LEFHRLGPAEASIDSNDIDIVCEGGRTLTPAYWNLQRDQYCFGCSFDVATGDPNRTVRFAFKVERRWAGSSFALDYQGAGPIPLGPPAASS